MSRILIVIAILGFLIVVSICSSNIHAVEYLSDEEPAPDSVEALDPNWRIISDYPMKANTCSYN